MKGRVLSYAPRGVRRVRTWLVRPVTVVAAAAVVAASVVVPVAGASATPWAGSPTAVSTASNGRYVVLLGRTPAASYRGGAPGLARTAPQAGDRYDARTPAARAYTAALRTRQDRLARSVGSEAYYHYTVSLNGFAADLSAQQARTLSRQQGVVAVVPDRVRHLDSWHTPQLLGLSGPTGMWRQLGGPASAGGAGRGTVIGVVDSGIDSDSASFATVGSGVPAGYSGSCQHGADDDRAGRFTCNDKLVGGRYFLKGQGGAGAVWEQEFLSPEDYNGHGSHTASTAAGNHGVPAIAEGTDLGRVSGTAPAAKVASYKACWTAADLTASCMTSDAVAAIDRAVADGVDVVDYSVSGTIGDIVDPVELAFLHAADSGVFVAASAGNRGPASTTVAHPSPWVTTVAAATHYAFPATVALGNGERYVGASAAPDDVSEAPLVLGRDVAIEGADPAEAQLCFPDTLDPAAVAGAIVVCDRGTSDRVEKSAVVANAGGVGALLVNSSPNSLNTDLHAVPTVHIADTGYDGIYAYVEGSDDPTAKLLAHTGRQSPRPPALGEISSRGPSVAGDGDVLKPDLAAPGIDVLGAVAPEGNGGHGYDFSSGTSMSAANVAGLAALLMQAHPRWSPMAVKSAMMTTTSNLTDTTDPFDQGAGFVQPRRMLDPGLVVDSGLPDWSRYLAGQGHRGVFPVRPLRASNLNQPSVAVNGLAGRERVLRTVTNVDDSTSTYSVAVHGFEGISVTAVPSVFTLAPGRSQTITLRVVRDSADLGAYQAGVVRLGDSTGGHRVRLPMVVRPVGVQAPAEVTLDRDTRIRTRAGVDATMVAKVRGLAPGVDTTGNGSDTSGADFAPGLEGLWSQTIEVAGPAELVRVQTLPDEPADDLDLFVLDEDGDVVAESASGKPTEEVTVSGLGAGTYTVYVQPWFVADPAGEATFTVRTFQVPRSPSGTLTVSPRRQEAVSAQDDRWQLDTGRLRPAKPYLGWVGWYRDNRADDELVGRTLVSVD